MNCWVYKQCASHVRNICPAYPAGGKSCWKVEGTKCDYGRIVFASAKERATYCGGCDYYLHRAGRG